MSRLAEAVRLVLLWPTPTAGLHKRSKAAHVPALLRKDYEKPYIRLLRIHEAACWAAQETRDL